MGKQDSLSQEIGEINFEDDGSPVTGLPTSKSYSDKKDPTYGLGCLSREKRRNTFYWYFIWYEKGERKKKYLGKELPPEYKDLLQEKRDLKGCVPKHSLRQEVSC